jgi:hypothetical protein
MKHKPGEKVPHSGIYSELTDRGHRVTEITCVKGEHFPPTERQGFHYELKIPAIHKPTGG